MTYNLRFINRKCFNQGGVFSDIPPNFFRILGQFNPLTASVLRDILLIFAHRKRDLRHCYQNLWTAPTYLTLTIYLLIALRMVYWTRCLLNNGHQLSTLLRVCCQKENTLLLRVCYREKKQMRTNQSLLDMTAKNDRFK